MGAGPGERGGGRGCSGGWGGVIRHQDLENFAIIFFFFCSGVRGNTRDHSRARKLRLP